MSTEAEIEAAREAWNLAVQHGGDSRAMLRRVLAAVEPLIRERLAQEVEDALHVDLDEQHEEHPEGTCDLCDWAGNLPDIIRAAIVRGDAS